MTVFIIGGSSRLGRAIAEKSAKSTLIVPDRTVYHEWCKPNASKQIVEWFGGCRGTVYVTAGLLDPRLSEEELFQVNFYLPSNILSAASHSHLRVVTFGTVMERFHVDGNAYIHSKRKLGEQVAALAEQGADVIHFQLHTLFGGGPPSPFMFLGQIRAALAAGMPFRMTSGLQLREYHHVDDDVQAIRMLEREMRGVVPLNHGRPVMLSCIAETLFGAFGRSSLLRIGALSDPVHDNYKEVLTPTAPKLVFRETLPAIVKYMEQWC